MKKKITYLSNPEDLSINKLFEVIEILGLFESSGKYFRTKSKVSDSISSLEIENILFELYEKDTDWDRRIKTAKKIYNSKAKFSKVEGNKKGSFINIAKGKELKEEPIYHALFIIGLSSLVLNNSLNLDFLNQFFQQEFPLSFLLFLYHSIKNKTILTLSYKSDRVETISYIKKVVPVKITYRDGHWILIGFSVDNNYFVQYMIHSIKSCNYYELDKDNQPTTYKKQISFNIKEFYQNSFGLSVLRDKDVYTIDILVPFEDKHKIQKRRSEGEWIKNTDNYIWKVKTQDPNEVFDYIFRWNGKLKILSPESMKQLFQNKIRNFLE